MSSVPQWADPRLLEEAYAAREVARAAYLAAVRSPPVVPAPRLRAIGPCPVDGTPVLLIDDELWPRWRYLDGRWPAPPTPAVMRRWIATIRRQEAYLRARTAGHRRAQEHLLAQQARVAAALSAVVDALDVGNVR